MTVTIVVAVGENGVIGRDGQMPWPPTGDMKQFKELTWGHPLVMGRTTFESIGRPLPGRTSVVLTRDEKWHPGFEDVLVAHDLDSGLAAAHAINPQIFLIGGAKVYAEALAGDLVDEIVLTKIPLTPDGDAFFDRVDPDRWTLITSAGFSGTPDYVIETWRRKRTSGKAI